MLKTNFFNALKDKVHVGEKVQIGLNTFYYSKYYYTHGVIVILIVLQFFLYLYIAVDEVEYYRVYEYLKDPEIGLPAKELFIEKQ